MADKTKLLIVDDEVVIRSTLSQIFVQTGYVVRVASDGFTALDQIRESVPDVLLSDLNMPGMSGFELLSVVRRRLPGVYVIATSGAYGGDGLPEGVAADCFYRKASRFGDLLLMVRDGASASVDSVREARKQVPLWVASMVDDRTGERYGVVSCPQCLRGDRLMLPVVGAEDGKPLIRETPCPDCETAIRYALVDALDPATSQPYARKADVLQMERGRGARAGSGPAQFVR